MLIHNPPQGFPRQMTDPSFDGMTSSVTECQVAEGEITYLNPVCQQNDLKDHLRYAEFICLRVGIDLRQRFCSMLRIDPDREAGCEDRIDN